MKRSLTQNKTIPPCLADSPETLTNPSAKEETTSKLNNDVARRARATVLGIAALSAGVFFPSQGEEALAAESSLNTLPITTKAPTNSDTEDAVSVVAANSVVVQESVTANTTPAVITPALIKHRVKDGDTLWDISQDYGLTPEAIAASNAIQSESVLAIGQTLKIPTVNGIAASEDDRPAETLVARHQPDASALVSSTPESVSEDSVVVPGTLDHLLNPRQDASELDLISPQVATEEQAAPLESLSVGEAVASPTTPTLSSDTNTRTREGDVPRIIASSSSESASTFSFNTEAFTQTERPAEDSVVIPETVVETTAEEPVAQNPESVIVAATQVGGSTTSRDSVFVPPTAVTGSVYLVQPGDTLDVIANRYGVSRAELMQANNIRNPHNLQINQELRIPRSEMVRTLVSQTPTVIYNGGEETSDSESTLVAQTPAATVASNLEDPANPYVERMANEIRRMREEYRAQRDRQTSSDYTESSHESSPQVAATPEPAPVNPEWQRQRTQASTSSVPSTTVVAEEVRQPQLTRTTVQRPNPQPSVVAAAPAPVQGYNRLLQLPSGQAVEPQLPPLQDRDQYLPERPPEFNGYIWPARGVLTSGYGPRWGRMHRGIDIAAPTGTPIYAAAAGEVITAGWNSGGYGNLVDIRHPDGSMTRYAHNSRLLVRPGQRVEQGQKIALMGSTGFSTGPHLHFEVHPAGRGAVNPMAFLPRNR
ncbi:peptidoglycan DD-metalloendopeptidase family protein [Spirulina subsalsa]|uniref:peptidoglycan DD-metalloendopeptidase family protein n=1 Tax=Spirulina subsalsa TaxID=54311 RepID=UPI0002D4ECD6|nr:peptidoglycan DD-metalloendopeptidase family protein [Spirulina subsalsa]